MRTKQAIWRALVVAVLISGCAATVPVNPNERPTLVDPARTNMGAYQMDYGQCAQLANQTDAQQASASNAFAGAAFGAFVGAALGAIVGAAFGDAGGGAAWGASFGAVDGAASGAAGGYSAGRIDQETALRNCLRGRGYKIIR